MPTPSKTATSTRPKKTAAEVFGDEGPATSRAKRPTSETRSREKYHAREQRKKTPGRRPRIEEATSIDEALEIERQAGRDEARQKTPADTQPKPSGSSGMRAPNVNLPGANIFSGGLDRTTSARIIVVLITLSAIAVIARDVMRGSPGVAAVPAIRPTGAGATVYQRAPGYAYSRGGTVAAPKSPAVK